jgi:phosphonate transport system substrate-binding protein
MWRHLALAVVVLEAACATVGSSPRPTPLVFGIAQPLGDDAARTASGHLGAYLVHAFGPGASIRAFAAADQLGDSLAKGTIDAAWMSPGAYVRAKAISPNVKLVVKLLRGQSGSYRSAFFTTAHGGRSLEDFRGKRLALVAPGSLSGRLYPLADLRKRGIDARTYFSEIVDARNHKEVCELVLHHTVDLGATISDDLGKDTFLADGCREAGLDPDLFQVIATSGPVPNDVIAVRAGLDAATFQRLQATFNAMPNDSAGRPAMQASFRADGVAPASDTDFDTVRELETLVTK